MISLTYIYMPVMMKLYVFNSFANYVIIIIPVTYIVTFIAEQVEQVGNLCALETLVIKQSALAGTNRSPGYRLTLGTHFVFLILVFFYLWFQHFCACRTVLSYCFS